MSFNSIYTYPRALANRDASFATIIPVVNGVVEDGTLQSVQTLVPEWVEEVLANARKKSLKQVNDALLRVDMAVLELFRRSITDKAIEEWSCVLDEGERALLQSPVSPKTKRSFLELVRFLKSRDIEDQKHTASQQNRRSGPPAHEIARKAEIRAKGREGTALRKGGASKQK